MFAVVDPSVITICPSHQKPFERCFQFIAHIAFGESWPSKGHIFCYQESHVAYLLSCRSDCVKSSYFPTLGSLVVSKRLDCCARSLTVTFTLPMISCVLLMSH